MRTSLSKKIAAWIPAVAALAAVFGLETAFAAPGPLAGASSEPDLKRSLSFRDLATDRLNATTAQDLLANRENPIRVKHTLVETGPHHRGWGKDAEELDASGASTRRGAGPKIVEMATGMNYWDGEKWVESDPSFDIGEDAFIADRLQYKVRLEPNLNVIGAVTIITPDGLTLRSTPMAIGLFDAASGKSAIIASISDSAGQLLADNQVIYEEAFNENGVLADVVYTIERGSFHQDIIFRGQLNPEDYGFPANSTRLQILTEFYDPPQPERIRRPVRVEEDLAVRNRMVSPDLVDELLGFGEFVLAIGRATPAGESFLTGDSAAPVAKEFKTVANRHFLVESVEYASIEGELRALPPAGQNRASLDTIRAHQTANLAYVSIAQPPLAASIKIRPEKAAPVELASTATPRPGLVIDYVATISGTISQAKVFQGDTTYFISGPVYCNGPVTIEGGAVFKYPNSTGANPVTAFIRLNNSLICKASNYQMAVFTAGDDDTVGGTLWGVWSGYTGNPTGKYYANPALWVYYLSSTTLTHLRFSHAQEALRIEYGTSSTSSLSHSQLVNCIRGIVLTGSGSGSGTGTPLTVHNSLVSDVQYPLTVNTILAQNQLVHCTVNNSIRLITATVSSSFSFINSIFANISSLSSGSPSLSGNFNGFYNSPQFGNNRFISPSVPFQASQGGGHYLTDASGFRAKGTTSINGALLNALKKKTTHPPVDFPVLMKVTGDLALFPQTPRYVSGATDLGYYYDALDFTVAAMISDAATITVNPGTAIGLRSDYYAGFALWKGSHFSSIGTPTKPNIFATLPAVQESSSSLAGVITFIPDGYDPPPMLALRFSNFHLQPEDFHFWGGWQEHYYEQSAIKFSSSSAMGLTMHDCNLFGGRINLGRPSVVLTDPGSVVWNNNLFERVDINLDPTWADPNDPVEIHIPIKAYNNLFRWSRLRMVPADTSEGSWVFRDNLFDKMAFEQDELQPIEHDFNGYWRRLAGEKWAYQTDRLIANNGDGSTDALNDQVLTSAPPYQTSTFGTYYLPITTPLFNKGSRLPGEAGLYHYTTRINQVKDGEETESPLPNKVNIGLHYVAAASGMPKDSDGDGIPDYIEDANGNGIVDSDETSPVLTHTLSGTPDAFNPVYDRADFDGDGLIGSMEIALGTNPLVSDNPLSIAPLLNGGLLTDTVTIEIQIASGFEAEHVGLTAYGVHLPHTDVLFPPFSSPIGIDVPTTQLANGIYLIRPTAKLNPNPNPNSYTIGGNILGRPVVVRVFNEISFAERRYQNGSLALNPWRETHADTAMAIDASSPYGPIDYEIEILNDAQQVVYSFPTAQSFNGLISREWDLYNQAGQYQQSPYFTARITVYWPSKADYLAQIPNSGIIQRNSPPSFRLTTTVWPSEGAWVIARQDFSKQHTQSLPAAHWPNYNGHAALVNAFDAFYQALLARHLADDTGKVPPPLPLVAAPGNAHVLRFMPATTQAQRDSDWAALKVAINDASARRTRNFWYLGHGSGSRIGGDDHMRSTQFFGGSAALLTAGEVNTLLQNNQFLQPNFHPFRFVFLDGCSTASGGFARAFGLPESPRESSHYFAPVTGTVIVRPQAFAGWLADIPFGVDNPHWAVFPGFAKFREQLFIQWSDLGAKRGFEESVVRATEVATAFDPTTANYEIYGVRVGPYNKSLFITGYKDITFQMGNYADPGQW